MSTSNGGILISRQDCDKQYKDSPVCELRKNLRNPQTHELPIFEQTLEGVGTGSLVVLLCSW
jgi:hypothetical protein